jgi:hypothetical protein
VARFAKKSWKVQALYASLDLAGIGQKSSTRYSFQWPAPSVVMGENMVALRPLFLLFQNPVFPSFGKNFGSRDGINRDPKISVNLIRK